MFWTKPSFKFQIFLRSKFLETKQVLDPIFFGYKIFLNPKFFWTQNCFELEWTKKIFGPKICLDPNFFKMKIFLNELIFLTLTFLDRKSFWNKKILDQRFFWPKKSYIRLSILKFPFYFLFFSFYRYWVKYHSTKLQWNRLSHSSFQKGIACLYSFSLVHF